MEVWWIIGFLPSKTFPRISGHFWWKTTMALDLLGPKVWEKAASYPWLRPSVMQYTGRLEYASSACH